MHKTSRAPAANPHRNPSPSRICAVDDRWLWARGPSNCRKHGHVTGTPATSTGLARGGQVWKSIPPGQAPSEALLGRRAARGPARILALGFRGASCAFKLSVCVFECMFRSSIVALFAALSQLRSGGQEPGGPGKLVAT